jgi:putative tryptophan/tyrosine transport system substrate-binding protein
MKRREFIALAGAAATSLPLMARGQPADQRRRIGVLMGISDDAEGQSRISALRQTLHGLGWEEGRDIIIDVRWAAGDVQRAQSYATELIDLAPTVIVANSALAVSALRQATNVIPIVFVQLNDPVGQGFVASLARPGANITGFLNFEPAMAGKWLEILKEVMPTLSRVAVIYNQATAARGSGGGIHMPLLEAVAPALRISLSPLAARDASDIERLIGEFARTPGGGIIVLPDVFNTVNRETIIAAAARGRLPAIYPYRYYISSGGLISYGLEITDLYRRAASYIDRILKGAKLGDLPVQAPTKFELIINLKTAKALGLTVPPTLLAQADEVIE